MALRLNCPCDHFHDVAVLLAQVTRAAELANADQLTHHLTCVITNHNVVGAMPTSAIARRVPEQVKLGVRARVGVPELVKFGVRAGHRRNRTKMQDTVCSHGAKASNTHAHKLRGLIVHSHVTGGLERAAVVQMSLRQKEGGGSTSVTQLEQLASGAKGVALAVLAVHFYSQKFDEMSESIQTGDETLSTSVGEVREWLPVPENLPNHPTLAFFGKRRTGKSTTITNLLFHTCQHIPFGMVLSDTAYAGYWDQIIPKQFIVQGLRQDVLDWIVARQKKAVEKYGNKDPRVACFVILDDVISDQKVIRWSADLTRFFVEG